MATTADILGSHRRDKIPARWSEHYKRLCAERDRLLARNCSAPETSRAKLDDLGEAASEESQTSLSLLEAGANQQSIAEVVEAIRRIEQGTYGRCEMTGGMIEAERLRAIPWTRYSLPGQAELEKAGLGRNHALPRLESLIELGPTEGQEEDETDAEVA
jgi:RNA polymerase-binding transcription factor DksA